MASPTSSTRRADRRRDHRGFTLTEIIISAGLAAIILTGVMTTFVMMGRTGALAQNYTELEVEARKALELFSREARMARGVSAYSATSVTLQIPDTSASRTGTGAGAYSVTYTFDTNAQTFTRTGPPITAPSGASATTVLVKNVHQVGTTEYIRYFRYVGSGYQTGFTTNAATNNAEIKQVELTFVAQRSARTVATATDKVLSARFILRNK
ncbi:prepilin-type N-terminal cleavage/methylation domain-containing protein [Opitutus sp. ER46]|uniref:PulJ/GspJ family protein n=1 Tax=Opitutus sp. ER46 TaxID=2161864 RepID=UPI001304DDBF|nr:prepilin-type N-terminal cleavage/methylation domain-containing protein [Opitutus sp. ER46]